VLSDIHGNLEALRAVLRDAAGEGATEVVCLGDTVGYGADPVACVDLVGERAVRLVAGNHEWGVVGRLDLGWFNSAARAAAVWTAGRLDPAQARYLEGLPLVAALEEATLVHASPTAPEEWDYLLDAEDGHEALRAFDTRLCFVGHSHRAAVWSVGSSGPRFATSEPMPPTTVALEDGRRYLVNVGSVGQPRDRDPRAAYAIWDREARAVALRRVPYDHRAAARKIREAGLPRLLADRLMHGA
jgi:diadenosine tetraphosphatase ApaH/serine/threonine PP2A family protein phosphatase